MQAKSDHCSLVDQRWPPGFRFAPTDEELILYYLKRKICRKRLAFANVITDTDVYKWDPQELPSQCALKNGDRQWYFFSPRDRKYPNGAGRSNRATAHGYWKATGKDRIITCNSRTVGVKKTLVYYQGRAPSGQRTDWVMHEYTLSEDEIKRCKSAAKDSYALYKVYKKSGPGPKNGEQYGALFVEEEWIDEDDPIDEVTPNLPQLGTTSNNNQKALVCSSSIKDIEQFLIGEDSQTAQLQTDTIQNLLPQVGDEVEESIWEAISSELSTIFHPSQQQQTVFNITEAAISRLPSFEAPEVTSAAGISDLDFDGENFLEINDLIGPEPTFSSLRNVGDSSTYQEDISQFNESELYFDATMFLNDVSQTNQGTASESYLDCLKDETVDRFDFQMPKQLYDADSQPTCLWSYDQNNNQFPDFRPNEMAIPQTLNSGTGTTNYDLAKDQQENQSGSWFTSAVWSFLDSVPTRPAEASETHLLKQTYNRMSSFGRVQIGYKKADVAAGVEISVVSRKTVSGTAKNGFMLISVVGGVCAVLCASVVGYSFFRRLVPSW